MKSLRHLPSVLFASLVLVGCGSDLAAAGAGLAAGEPSRADPNASASAGEAACGPVVEPRCAPALHVTSAAEIVAEAAKLPWQKVSLSLTGGLSVGSDLVAEEDIVVDAADLAAPADCPTTPENGLRFAQCHVPLFREYGFPRWEGKSLDAGTSCLEASDDRPMRKGETCKRLAIAKGTSFRLRAVIEDMHPSAPTYWSFIEIERPCSAPCGAGEQRCEATQTCFEAGYSTCAFCEGKSSTACACREGCGSKPDGTSCAYDSSPDVLESGTCKAGSCIAKR